jgi:hypothetical protein
MNTAGMSPHGMINAVHYSAYVCAPSHPASPEMLQRCTRTRCLKDSCTWLFPGSILGPVECSRLQKSDKLTE